MINLRPETIKLLDDIENRIDPEVEQDYLNQWDDFLHGKFTGDIFYPERKKKTKPSFELPKININDALEDYETMFIDQLVGVSKSLSSNSVANVRSNYGTGIMSSVFGAEIFVMPRKQNTLPTTKPFGNADSIRKLLDKQMPDLYTSFAGKALEMGEIYAELFTKYPKISKFVPVYHPDTQGPLDILELLWGSDMFYGLYDEPELTHDMLGLICDTYIAYLEKWFKMFPQTSDWATHWDCLAYRGKIVLRNDSAMNISSDMYAEFAKPYDERLLKHFGGGIIHFCGRGDHYIEVMSGIEGLTGINMSQPHLNNRETIYKNTVDKGLNILAYSKEFAKLDASRENKFNHRLSSIR